eukprot:Rmarinus@m.19235
MLRQCCLAHPMNLQLLHLRCHRLSCQPETIQIITEIWKEPHAGLRGVQENRWARILMEPLLQLCLSSHGPIGCQLLRRLRGLMHSRIREFQVLHGLDDQTLLQGSEED